MAQANKSPSKPPDAMTVTSAVKSTVEREIKLAVDPPALTGDVPGPAGDLGRTGGRWRPEGCG